VTVLSAPTVLNTDTNRTRIKDRRTLSIVRAVWMVFFLLNVAIIVIDTPYYYNFIRTLSQSTPAWGDGLRQLGWSAEFPALLLSVLDRLTELFLFVLAFIIFYNRSDNWMALLLSSAFVLLATAFTPLIFLDASPAGLWVETIIFYLMIILSLALFYVLPDGRFMPERAKWLIIPFLIWEFFENYHQMRVSDLFLSIPFILWVIPSLTVCFIGIGAQVYRYRRGSIIYRQQVKWFLVGLTVIVVTQVLYATTRTMQPAATAGLAGGSALIILKIAQRVLTDIGLLALGTGLGFAVTRYHLYDVDIVINRSLVYSVVTLLLGTVFIASIFVIQSVLGAGNTVVAFAVSAIGPVLLFNPTRKRVQRFIDRRIFHLKFDLNQLAAAQKLPEVKNPGALTGKIIGGYQVLGVLGKGGMGEVYQGHDNGNNVALKILPEDLAQQSEFVSRFEREANTMRTLNHPNIVKLMTSGEQDGVRYLALEYIEGVDLSQQLKHDGKLAYEDVRTLLRDLAAALDYAHEQGFVHRDIKPSNVMVRDGDLLQAVLMDFGIAKIKDAVTSYTGSGAIGTIDYMAPEQIMAAAAVNKHADIYALGVMVYEMLSGERPFKGGPAQVMFAHLQQPAPNVRDVMTDVPKNTADAIERALSKDPTARYESAGAFAAAL
jgi:predicted Ser/Thr protein kinase